MYDLMISAQEKLMISAQEKEREPGTLRAWLENVQVSLIRDKGLAGDH